MAAFMIFLREGEVFNAQEMEAYRESNQANKQDFKLQPLVVYGNFETLGARITAWRVEDIRELIRRCSLTGECGAESDA